MPFSLQRSPTEDFLRLVEKSRRGCLKVYLGYARATGKTRRLLNDARYLQKRGVDVVLAFIDARGRADLMTLTEGLEYVPRRRIEYLGMVIEEMDIEAVLARRPQVAIVDDLAHTNIPGSRHEQRYQDVRQLIAAGINVISAVDVLCLPEAADKVRMLDGQKPLETLPLNFFRQADQVVALDTEVSTLMTRLVSGDQGAFGSADIVYSAENLESLRHLAMNIAANQNGFNGQTSGSSIVKRKAGNRVMVCLPPMTSRAETLLGYGQLMAEYLGTSWFAVHVSRMNDHAVGPAMPDRRLLEELRQKAQEKGAEWVHLQSPKPMAVLLDFARSHGVRHIILGRIKSRWWRQIISRPIVMEMLEEAAGFDLHLIDLDNE